jgi:hypothetical protein
MVRIWLSTIAIGALCLGVGGCAKRLGLYGAYHSTEFPFLEGASITDSNLVTDASTKRSGHQVFLEMPETADALAAKARQVLFPPDWSEKDDQIRQSFTFSMQRSEKSFVRIEIQTKNGQMPGTAREDTDAGCVITVYDFRD